MLPEDVFEELPPEGVPSLSTQKCALFFIILNAIRMYANYLLVYVVVVYLPLLERKLLKTGSGYTPLYS